MIYDVASDEVGGDPLYCICHLKLISLIIGDDQDKRFISALFFPDIILTHHRHSPKCYQDFYRQNKPNDIFPNPGIEPRIKPEPKPVNKLVAKSKVQMDVVKSLKILN